MFVIGGEDNILRGCLFFIAENRTALYIYRIVDGKLILGNRVRDSHGAATLGRGMVRQVILGGSNILLQIICGNLRVFPNGDSTIFRNIQQAAQTVAGNGAAEMILQGIGLRIRFSISILIVIGPGGEGVCCTHMNPVGGDYRFVRHRSTGGSPNGIIHTGAAYTDNAAVSFLGGEAGLIHLGRNKISLSRKIPLTAEGAGDVVRGSVFYMGAHIAHETAATCVGQGLARVLAISRYL